MNTTLVRPTIAALSGYVPGEQPQGRRFIKLNTNENPYAPSPQVVAAWRGFDPTRLRLYPDPAFRELRETAGTLFGLSADWVLCGNGSDDLLTIAVRTFVESGGCLAHLDPSYSLYPVLAQIQGAQNIAVPLDAQFELPDDAAGMAAGATLLFVARPNAPTGNAFALERMHRLCREFAGVVWIDEAYADFAPEHCVDFVRQYPNVVVSRTLSKSYSLAGARLGLAFANPALVAEMMKVKDSYNVNALTQALGVAALRDNESMRANVQRILATRDMVGRELRRLGFEVLPSAANFVFTRPPCPAAALLEALRERGVLVRHFPGPRTGAFLRVTIGTPEEMSAFIEATAAVLSDGLG